MKTLLILLFIKFGKVFISAGSILFSIMAYATHYGWSYAAGFVGLILFHEMGHYIAARQKNLDVGLPMFIPFVGAWIQLKEQPQNAETEAYIAYAGPFIGTLAAFAIYFWGRVNDSGLALALAQAGFIINLFNLIPIHPLDGGRITSVISPKIWFLGAPILIAMWVYQPSPLLIIIAILAFPQLIKAWNYNQANEEDLHYYDIPNAVRFEYGALYLILVTILALMIK